MAESAAAESIRRFFASLAELKSIAYLEQTFPDFAIVGDKATIAHLAAASKLDKAHFFVHADPSTPVAVEGIKDRAGVLVCSLAHEAALYDNVTAGFKRARLSKKPVFRLIADALFARALYMMHPPRSAAAEIATLQRLAAMADPPRPAVKAYTLFNTPRAGSTALAESLKATGVLGRPAEHVRAPLLALAARPEFDFVRWWKLLMEVESTPNKVFASKFISHFLFDLLAALGPERARAFVDILTKGAAIHLVRRDKVRQAISHHRAETTGVWHARGAAPKAAYAGRRYHYDYAAIARHRADLARQEKDLESWLAKHFRNVETIYYEDIEAESHDAAVERLRALLKVKEKPASPKTAYRKLADDVTERIYARFAAEERDGPSRCPLCGGGAFAPADADTPPPSTRGAPPSLTLPRKGGGDTLTPSPSMGEGWGGGGNSGGGDSSFHDTGPYWACAGCGAWLQFGFAGAPAADALQPFDDRAKAVNEDLAKRLVAKYRPAAVLDVGCGYPYLVQCFQGAGVARALGVDRAPAVVGAGRELGVEVRVGDFLALDFGAERFDLITMIHALEEFVDPAQAIAKAKSLLTDGGVIFVRTACVDAPGIEAFLAPPSVRQNPVLFSRAALRRTVAAAGFEVVDEWLPPNTGEVDVQAWLPETAIARDDCRVSVCLASHNEEAVIRRCLDSVRALAWEVVVYLNNCTDRTPEILKEWSVATKIPVRVIDGYWDDNFARAKNGACLAARGTHVAWMDADDVLVNPDLVLKTLTEKPDHCQDWRMTYGNETLFHLRLWPNVKAPFVPHFHDRCHEYVELGRRGAKRAALSETAIEHRPKANRDSTDRNIRILERALSDGPSRCAVCGGEENGVGRTLFYLANAYREKGRHADAVQLYDRYLSGGHGWHDERCWAHLYKAQSLARLGRADEALDAALAAVKLNPHWAEPYLRVAWQYFDQERFDVALRWAQHVVDLPKPKTLMFLDETAYRDQPWRLTSLCWEKLGNVPKALVTGEVALARMAAPDPAWGERLAKLKATGRPRRAVIVGLAKRPGSKRAKA